MNFKEKKETKKGTEIRAKKDNLKIWHLLFDGREMVLSNFKNKIFQRQAIKCTGHPVMLSSHSLDLISQLKF